MFYEFNISSGDWVVAGKSRSDFYISTADGSHLEFKAWLVPMKAGKLFLPSVSVHPLPSIESSQRQNEQAQEEMYDNLPTCETYQEDAATCLEIVESVASSTEFYFDPATGAVDYPHNEVQ